MILQVSWFQIFSSNHSFFTIGPKVDMAISTADHKYASNCCSIFIAAITVMAIKMID